MPHKKKRPLRLQQLAVRAGHVLKLALTTTNTTSSMNMTGIAGTTMIPVADRCRLRRYRRLMKRLKRKTRSSTPISSPLCNVLARLLTPAEGVEVGVFVV